MKGRTAAAQTRHDEAVALAWHTEALARADHKKPLPSLKKLLARRTEPADRQTPDDMLAVFRGFEAAGAPMKIRRIA